MKTKNPLVSTRITKRIAKARWAWSELTSPRFARKYLQLGPDAVRLQYLARSGASFASLPKGDKEVLAALIELRQPGFMAELERFDEFVCEEWSKDELYRVTVVPALSADKQRNILYEEFIKNPPHFVQGQPEWSDPRHSAESWPANKLFIQDEPGLAVIAQAITILVDGYARSVLFVQHGKPDDRYLVWVPATSP